MCSVHLHTYIHPIQYLQYHPVELIWAILWYIGEQRDLSDEGIIVGTLRLLRATIYYLHRKTK